MEFLHILSFGAKTIGKSRSIEEKLESLVNVYLYIFYVTMANVAHTACKELGQAYAQGSKNHLISELIHIR